MFLGPFSHTGQAMNSKVWITNKDKVPVAGDGGLLGLYMFQKSTSLSNGMNGCMYKKYCLINSFNAGLLGI